MSGPRVYNVTVESSGTLYGTRPCPKKNWRGPSALNLWIQGGQYMISMKSLRVFSHPRALLEHSLAEYKGVFTWENSHRREFHTGMTFWFRIAFTWWLGHFISCYLTVHFMLIKYTCGSKSQTLRMRYLFQSTGRPTSHRNGWSFRIYMIPLRDFVPEWNSRPGTRTKVNSRWGDSRRQNILWCYHVIIIIIFNTYIALFL